MEAKKELTLTLNQDESETLVEFFKYLNPEKVCELTGYDISSIFVRDVLNITSGFMETYYEAKNE